jgi:hypothetical protein
VSWKREQIQVNNRRLWEVGEDAFSAFVSYCAHHNRDRVEIMEDPNRLLVTLTAAADFVQRRADGSVENVFPPKELPRYIRSRPRHPEGGFNERHQ